MKIIRPLSVLIGAIILSTFSYGQEIKLSVYKQIYKAADSLKANGLVIDSVSFFKMANELDKKHPSEFFAASSDNLRKSKLNEASFLYYLGLARYRYYNAVNPKYQASEDGALLASFKYSLGELVNMYLRTDVDNFIAILNLTVSYYNTNDYNFIRKKRNDEKYFVQIKPYTDLIEELRTNKDKYNEKWTLERKSMEVDLDRAIEEEKKRSKN